MRHARSLAVLALIATVTACGSAQHATVAQSVSPTSQRAAIERAVRKSGAGLGVGRLRGFKIRISAVDRRAYTGYAVKVGRAEESGRWCRVWPPAVPVSKAIGVTLTATGHLAGTCHGMPCTSNGPLGIPLLYGRSISVGPFRCTALRGAVRCVVEKTGRGFLPSAARIEPV